MTYYQNHLPPGFLDERDKWAGSLAQIFADTGDTNYLGIVHDQVSGAAVSLKLKELQPDVIMIAPSMPGPGGFVFEAIRAHTDIPVLVWAVNHLDALPVTYNSVDHLMNSTNVGACMITNLLVRAGLGPAVVSGRWYDPAVQDRVRMKLRALGTARQIRNLRVGVIGKPLAGYDNVIVDPDLLAGLGPELIDVSVGEFVQCFNSIKDSEIATLKKRLVASYMVTPSDGEELDRSCRLALTVEHIAADRQFDCGTFNSHMEYSNRNPEIGLVGALANSHITSSGIPFTDTGDIITAIAMFVGKRLSGTAMYTELNTIDYSRNALLCANTGEGDFDFAAAPGDVRIFSAGDSTGLRQQGYIIDLRLRDGPATLIGFSPRADVPGGFVLMAMRGSIDGRPDILLQVPHHYFKPSASDVNSAFEMWASAGATHHCCLSEGDLCAEVGEIARKLGIGFEQIA